LLTPTLAHLAYPQRRSVPPEVQFGRVEINTGELLLMRLGDGVLPEQRMAAKGGDLRPIEQQLQFNFHGRVTPQDAPLQKNLQSLCQSVHFERKAMRRR
jgi:hypothetical protein